jgi:hypothetical protein
MSSGQVSPPNWSQPSMTRATRFSVLVALPKSTTLNDAPVAGRLKLEDHHQPGLLVERDPPETVLDARLDMRLIGRVRFSYGFKLPFPSGRGTRSRPGEAMRRSRTGIECLLLRCTSPASRSESSGREEIIEIVLLDRESRLWVPKTHPSL